MLLSIREGSYEKCRVALACPSVGNVSQLALDLIISSVKCVRIGSIWDPAVLPFIGADPFDSQCKSPCTSCDVYFSAEQNLMLIQFRASLTSDNQAEFLNELVNWFKELKVSELIILSGVFSVGHYDEDVKYGSFRYVCCPLSYKHNGETFNSLGWTRMKKNSEETKFACPSLSGAGFARRLFNVCVDGSLPCTVLLHFCLEGDNVSDGVSLVKKTNDWFKCLTDDEQIVIPSSWNCLFGNPTPDMMY